MTSPHCTPATAAWWKPECLERGGENARIGGAGPSRAPNHDESRRIAYSVRMIERVVRSSIKPGDDRVARLLAAGSDVVFAYDASPAWRNARWNGSPIRRCFDGLPVTIVMAEASGEAEARRPGRGRGVCSRPATRSAA